MRDFVADPVLAGIGGLMFTTGSIALAVGSLPAFAHVDNEGYATRMGGGFLMGVGAAFLVGATKPMDDAVRWGADFFRRPNPGGNGGGV